MRVLFLNDLDDPRIGSSIRQMYQEAERLRALGHQAAVASATEERASATGAGEPVTIEGTPVFRLWSRYDPRWRAWVALDNPRVRAPFRALLARWQPDVVHAHLVHGHLGYASLTAARAAGAGVVFTAHDSMTFCYQKLTCFHGGPEHDYALKDYRARWQKCIPCQRLRYRPGRNAAIRRVLARDVHRFTAVSEELATAIRANDIRVDRVVHNALRPRAAPPAPEAVAALRARLGLEGKRTLAIVGRLHEQKGAGQALRYLAALAGRFPDLVLLALGKADVYEREFRPLARELGVEERVRPTGWLEGEELHAAYALADVVLYPSICFDTFGLVNVEAMEHGRPVVATSFGGSPEVVEDGVTGFVAHPFDVEAWAERIGRLLSDPALARRMGEAGRARVLERFTIERLTDEFLEEYERALALARGGSR
jgi:glycosyltransferase involved in cell wall biosynthesis